MHRAEGVWEGGAEENILGQGNRVVEKITYWGI
jgi:hypothetical protein